MRTRRYMTAALLGASALTAPFAMTPALAQGSEDATVDSNTIVVTAQRRSEAIEDVPMTVAVVTPETLAALGVNTVRDLQNVTSGFSLNQSGTYPQPSVRGVTTTNSGSYENNVALWVDGLYQITPQVLNMDLPNVQNIQILKGPQGALYGRNATGGAILIETLDPGDLMTGNVEATYGRFKDRRLRGFVSGPLSDKIGFSLAGTYRKTDGYYKKVSLTNPTTLAGRALGLEQQSVRAKLKADLTDTFRATIAYNFTHANDPRGAFFTPVENLNGTFPRRNLGEVAGDAFALNFKQHEASLKLELETSIGTLRSVTGYQQAKLATTYDSDGRYSSTPTAATETYADSLLIDKTWQENLDFTINAIDSLDLIIGATYFHNAEHYGDGRANVTYLFPNANPAAGPGTPLSAYSKLSEANSRRTKEAWAGFVDATFHATDKLSINVGGRYSTETQNIAAIKTCFLINAALGCPVATVPTVRYNASAKSTYSKFTPRASIRYEVSPRVNVYASYSQGFKAGEWNGVIPGDNPVTWRSTGQIGQETIDSFEVGIKSGGSRLRFDLAGFYSKYHDIQVSSVQFVNGVTSVLLQSLPRAKIYGVEGNVDFDVTSELKLRGGGTWLHARYGKGAYYRGAGVIANGAVTVASSTDPLKNLPNTSPVSPLWQDLTGLQMARAPNFSGYFGFEYDVPQGEGGFKLAANLKYTSSYVVTDPSIWGGETDASYQAHRATNPVPNNQQNLLATGGAAYLDRANEQRARQGSYVLLNASVTWTDPSDHYYVRVWGNNLTDKKYRVHYRPSSRTYAPIGEPLTFGLTVGFKFGGEREAAPASYSPPPPPPPPPPPVVEPTPPPPPPPPPRPNERG